MNPKDALLGAYLNLYNNSLCLSKFIDENGDSTLDVIQNQDQLLIEDKILFFGINNNYFDWIIKLHTLDLDLYCQCNIPMKYSNEIEILKIIHTLNKMNNACATSFNFSKSQIEIKSSMILTGYGLSGHEKTKFDSIKLTYSTHAIYNHLLTTVRFLNTIIKLFTEQGLISKS